MCEITGLDSATAMGSWVHALSHPFSGHQSVQGSVLTSGVAYVGLFRLELERGVILAGSLNGSTQG